MTQSTVCATEPDEFVVTDDMRERHARFVAEMTRTIWEMWEESGDVAAHPEQAARWIRVVESEWAVDAREEWMHPMRSIAVRVQMDPEEPPRGADRLDWFDAWRTWEGLHEHDRITWTARCLGLTRDQVKTYLPDRHTYDLSGKSALYRYFDRRGTLLYVGIAKDPDKRDGEHRHTAEWYEYATRRTLEWRPDRRSALDAETAAIRAEEPIFNRLGRTPLDERDDVSEYMMWRELEKEYPDLLHP